MSNSSLQRGIIIEIKMQFNFNKCISNLKNIEFLSTWSIALFQSYTFRSEFQGIICKVRFLFLVCEIAIMMKYLLAFPLLVAL